MYLVFIIQYSLFNIKRPHPPKRESFIILNVAYSFFIFIRFCPILYHSIFLVQYSAKRPHPRPLSKRERGEESYIIQNSFSNCILPLASPSKRRGRRIFINSKVLYSFCLFVHVLAANYLSSNSFFSSFVIRNS